MSELKARPNPGKQVATPMRKRKWDRFFSDSGYRYGKTPSILSQRLVGRLPSHAMIAELGGGYGRDAVYFAKQGHKVVCFDLSDEALRLGRIYAKEQGIKNIIFRQTTLPRKLNLPDHCADAVFANMLFNMHTPKEIEKTLKEIRRVIKHDGIFTFTLRSTRDVDYREGKRLRPKVALCCDFIMRFYTKKDIYRVFQKHDFKIVKIKNGKEHVQIKGEDTVANLWYVEMRLS